MWLELPLDERGNVVLGAGVANGLDKLIGADAAQYCVAPNACIAL